VRGPSILPVPAAQHRADHFDERLHDVQIARARAQRRNAVIEAGGTAALSGGAVLVGGLLGGGVGILLAVVGLGAAVVSRPTLRRVAARRGALAWDWQAQRYRLVGDPSARVQELDRPATRPL